MLPRNLTKNRQTTPELVQENKDAQKLSRWKQALKGIGNSKCSDEVRDYLDIHLESWRTKTYEKSETTSTNEEILEIIPVPKTKKIIQKTKEEEQEEIKEIIPVPKKKSMKLTKPKKVSVESEDKKCKCVKTEISILHQRYKTLKSENLHQEFNKEPKDWYRYHEISEENEKSFPEEEVPRNRIIEKLNIIKTKRTKLVVDMGCGKAQISSNFKDDNRFKFINFDHIAFDEKVRSCDISNLPIEENAVEICILSLAMWGSNCEEYIQEAYRVLETGGTLYIIEPTKRWSEKDEYGNIIEGKEGCKLTALLDKNNLRVMEQSIQKFCLFICVKV